jgi:hypothetical protein
MIAFNTQVFPQLYTNQVIDNHVPIQTAAEISGYNAQYLRRLLRAGRLDGRKVGQIWLVNIDSLQEYFGRALCSEDVRWGPKGAWQPPF